MNLRLNKYHFKFIFLVLIFLSAPLCASTEPRIYLQVLQKTPLEISNNEIANLQVLVRNEHSIPKTFRINVFSPEGWTVLQGPEYYLSLMPGETIQQTLVLKSENVDQGFYHFTVQITDIDNVEKVALDDFDIQMSSNAAPEFLESAIQDEVNTLPGDAVTFATVIENPYEEAENFTIDYRSPSGWNILPCSQETIELEPKQNKIIPFAVQIPKNALAGTYTITAAIKNDHSEYVQQNFQVRVVENKNISVSFENNLLMHPSDEPYCVKALCKNLGNTPVNLQMKINIEPFSICNYETNSIILDPGASYEFPIWIEPCGIPCEKKQFIFVGIFDDCDEQLYRQTLQVELLPKGVVNSDPYLRIPSRLRTFVAGQQGEWVAGVEFSGKGVIDPDNDREIEYIIRYPTNSRAEIYDTFQVFYLGLREPDWQIDLGDTIYELSPLTERWRYARGAGFYFDDDKWDSGLFYAQGIFGRHDSPKELGYYIGYEPTEIFRLESNFLYKKCDHLSPSHIVSQQAIVDIFDQTTLQVEFARDFNSIRKGDPFGFYGEWRGRLFKDSWYYVEKIHTGQDYFGYYSHFDQFSTGIDLGLCSRLRVSFSTNQLKQNFKYKHCRNYRVVPYQVQYNGQLNCGFNNGISTALTYLNLRAKDFGRHRCYDFDQYWGGFNFSYANEKFSFLAITQLGLQNNLLNHKTLRDLQKYQLFACWTFSEKLNANLSYETGHTNYYEAKPWRHAFGGGINYFPNPQTWLQIYAQRNQQFVHAHSQNQFTARLRTVFPNRHAIGFAGQYFHNSKFRHSNEYLFLIEYIIPLNLPVCCRKDISDIQGTLYSDFDTPVSNAIVNLGGQRSITDCNGAFSFQSLCPGVYNLKTELLPKNMINSEQEPIQVDLIGGKKNLVSLRIVKGGKISGTLTIYDYLNSLGQVESYIDPNNEEPLILHEREFAVGYRVTLDRENGKEIYSCITSTRGRFSFEGLRPGRWRVSITEGEIPEYHMLEKNDFYIDVKEGQEIKLPLRVMPELRKIKSLE